MSTVFSGFLSIATRMGYLRMNDARQLYERLQKSSRKPRERNETATEFPSDGESEETFEEVMINDVPACIQQ